MGGRRALNTRAAPVLCLNLTCEADGTSRGGTGYDPIPRLVCGYITRQPFSSFDYQLSRDKFGVASVTMQAGPPTLGPHVAGRAWIGEPAILGYQIIR